MKDWNKITYGIGAFGTALSYQSFAKEIQNYYTAVVGLPTWLLGGIWVIYGIWNAVNDPLMGRLSDKTRSRYGRRIPYILLGAIPLGILYLLLWSPPAGFAAQFDGAISLNLSALSFGTLTLPTAHLILVAYFVIILFAFDTLWTLVVIAWSALFPELWPDLIGRAAASGWREGFSLIAAFAAVGLSTQVIQWIGYRGMGIAFGALTALAFLVSTIGNREDTAELKQEAPLSLWASLRMTFRIPSFRWFLIANLAKEFVFLTMAALVPFYARDVLHEPSAQSVLLGIPFVLSVPGMLVWTRLIQRLGSRTAWLYASLAMLPGFITLLIAPNVLTAMLGAALLIIGFPGHLMITNIMLADVIDEDEVISGQRREGFFYGMNGAIIRLAFSWQGILFAAVPTITGYQPFAPVQSLSAQWGFRFMFAGAPIIAALVMAFALWKYPLHGTALREMRARKDQRRIYQAAALLSAD